MTDIPLPIRLQGVHGSPYTRKMLAVLRYKRLPYRFIIGMPNMPAMPGSGADRGQLPVPKVPLLPTFYLPDAQGKLQAVTDSTPLIRRIEAAFPERSVIPADPVMAFLNYVIEDYADEWLTRCMFHYRWSYEADIGKAGTVLPLLQRVDLPDPVLAGFSKQFTERQIGRLHVVGSDATTAPVIEDSYVRFLDCMEAMLRTGQFVLGNRPSSADFGLMGQLTCLTHFDPTPMRICEARAPRTYAWVERAEDLCGYEITAADWCSPEDIADALLAFLREVARTHLPQMLANARAVAAGEKEFETEIDGKPWRQPSFPYQAKCLRWTREEFAQLSETDRGTARNILRQCGLLPLVEADTGF